MKKLLSFCLVFITICTTNAQKIKKHSCSTDNLHWNLLEKNSKYKEIFEKSNQDWQRYAPSKKAILENSNNRPVPLQSPVTLSVVFHNMVTQSLPYTGVYDPTVNYANVIANLNTVFSGISVSPTRPSDISFCLATKDINGDKYVGNQIRHFTSISNLDSNEDAQINQIWLDSGSLIKFSRAKYINVYVVDEILGDVAGFAYLPPNHGNDNDGIYMELQWLKNANPHDIKNFAHEMGHYLGLFHVFGICKPGVIGTLTDANGYNPCSCNNGNCLFNGDMVCDTPPSMIYSVAPFNSCDTDHLSTVNDGLMPLTDINDDKSNYMDYGLQSGQDHFTRGQILRMQFMVDPEFGPRKTLLGVAACTDCTAMEGCSFKITALPTFAVSDTRHEITQTASGTPAYVFSATATCPTTTPIVGLAYSWNLVLLTNNTTIGSTQTGVTYTTQSTLVPGNYQLTLTSGVSQNCSEITVFNFVIYPMAGNCNLSLPSSNSDWTGWKRISFQDGWVRSNVAPTFPYNYGNATAPIVHGPRVVGDAGFDDSGFDILLPSALSDVNYPSSPAGLPSSITKIMRVGRVVGGQPIPSGSAYYAKVTIPINASNCKYRVWYLGTTEGTIGDVKFPFHLNNGINDTSFGLMSKYLYNSPVNTTSSANNSIIGFDENGNLISNSYHNRIQKSYLVSQNFNDNISNYLTTNSTNRKMATWQSFDLEYSEFVILGTQTEILLTFFSHSNATTGNAFKNSYAYYGIECLGGGLPQDFDFNVPDISVNCSSPNDRNSIEIPLPDVKYGVGQIWNDSVTVGSANFSSIQLLIKNNATGNYVNPTYTPKPNSIKFEIFTNLAPYVDCRLIYKTFHKIISRDFRVFIGFANNLPACTTGDKIDLTEHPNGGIILVCDILPKLFLTPTCVTQESKYQWTKNGNNIIGQNSATLDLANAGLNENDFCPKFIRKTIFKEPYCNNDNIKYSDEFQIYFKNKFIIAFSEFNAQNICLGDPYVLNVTNLKFYNDSGTTCVIPNNTFDNVINNFSAQMVTSTGDLIGSIQPFVINGQINYLTNYGNFNLTFNNLNTQGQPYFVPTATINSFTIGIRITGNYLGCAIDKIFPNVQEIAFNQSADGGNIAHTTNCATSTITTTSSNAGATNNNQYVWEYSHSPTFSNDINVLTGQTGATISNISTTAFGASPAYIRRKSLPFSNCPNVAYSNILTINPTIVTPNFPASYTVCTGDASPLPTVSSNQVTGSWSPVYTPNTSRTYTFTANTGQCVSGTVVTVQVIVTPKIVAVITKPNLELCQNQLPYLLPTTDNASHSGTWSFNSQIVTAVIVAGIYTFNPNGTCVTAANQQITINSGIQPSFSLLNEYCVGTIVPLSNTSSNGITGIWHLGTSTANLTSINTSTAGIFTYNFISNTTANCQNYSKTITITPGNITPTFNILTSLCTGTQVPTLPTVSTNIIAISGTWSPAVVNNIATANYTFTPNAGQCAKPVTVTITVNNCQIYLNWGSEVSCQLSDGSTEPGKHFEDIADGPCIRVCENSTVGYWLTGSVGNIISTDWIVTGGTIISSNSISCTIQWNSVNFSLLQGIIHFAGGSTLDINKCIERLQAPIANFGILPSLDATDLNACLDAPVNFQNLSSINDGDTNMYYRWDFGDGTTSTATNPTHVFNQVGDYEVTLRVFNGCSCTNRISKIVHVLSSSVAITCVGLVCKGSTKTYNIPENFASCNDLEWTATNGTVISTEANGTKVTVHWDNPNNESFGLLSVSSNNCVSCIAPVRIPILPQQSTIIGSTAVCASSQSTYRLPEMPSTIFNWSLVNNAGGSNLIGSNQSNQIVLNAGASGTVRLICNYFNTLLGCGGTAEMDIDIRSTIKLQGAFDICLNSTNTYSIVTESGDNVIGLNWTMISPTGIVYNGSGSPFTYTFNTLGTYLFNINGNASSTCYSFNTINVKTGAGSPNTISGTLVVCPSIPTTYTAPQLSGSITHWEVIGGLVNETETTATGNSITVMFNPSLLNYQIKTWYSGNNNGCQSTVLTTNITRDNPTVIVKDGNNNTNNTFECGSSYQTYTVNNIAANSYEWTISPTSAGSIEQGINGTSIKVLWNQPLNGGQINAVLKLKAVRCGVNYLKNFNVTIISAPIVTLIAPATACAGTSFQSSFTLNPNSAFTSSTWDFGDGSPLQVVNYPVVVVPHSFPNNSGNVTTYTIKVTVNGAFGCVFPGVQTKSIIVSPAPVVAVSPTSISCEDFQDSPNLPHVFTVTKQGGFAATDTIQWYLNGLQVSAALGGNNPVIDFTNPALGYGNYTAVVKNIYNCSGNTISCQYKDCIPGCSNTNINAVVTNNTCAGIRIQISQLPSYPTTVTWDYDEIPNPTIVTNNSNVFEATDIKPGQYVIRIKSTIPVGFVPCKKAIPFTIPYRANIKYKVECAANNMYKVNILDFSEFSPETPIQNYSFTYDNGGNWYSGTVVNGVHQLEVNLPPGTHNIGIKIGRLGYPDCVKILPLVLTPPPVATFHFNNNVCQDTAMQFFADDTSPGLQYEWFFSNDDSRNLQRDPVKSWSTGGSKDVQLKVTNSFGCSTLSTTVPVTVKPVALMGKLVVNPNKACEGSAVNINYDHTLIAANQTVPVLFKWYKNLNDTFPFTTYLYATTAVPTLSVTQSGEYFTYVTNELGCEFYFNRAVTVNLLAAPKAPIISAPSQACVNAPFTLSVPHNINLIYNWTLNGVVQTQWNGLETINFTPTDIGAYIFTCSADAVIANACGSPTTSFTVNVNNPPNVPVILFERISCNPYIFKARVTNPQPGIVYNWSNGGTGESTFMYHSGPLQVIARNLNCQASAQIDLPLDLNTLAWMFPEGCFELCEDAQGYLVNSQYSFESWKWLENDITILSGSGPVNNLEVLQPYHNYQLSVSNGYCEKTISNISITKKECKKCDFTFDKLEAIPIKVDGNCLYKVNMYINNPYPIAMSGSITAPNGEGLFVNTSFTILPGSNLYQFLFYPSDPNLYANVDIEIHATSEKIDCKSYLTLSFKNYCTSPKPKSIDTFLGSNNKNSEENMLLLAPNPAQESTTVFYSYENKTSQKTIEIADMIGRILLTLPLNEESGSIILDCTQFAKGNYLVLMKENNIVIKNSKLVVN